MGIGNSLTTAGVLAAFSGEIALYGGKISETFDDGERLMVRSVLPLGEDVRTGDKLQGGVALRFVRGEICVNPYVFRLVCKNGAIMAQSLASRKVEGLAERPEWEAVREIRAAVGACCAPEVFAVSMEQIRSVRDVKADFALNMMSMLSRLGSVAGSQFMRRIMARFFGEGDLTQFGLMNAVTSVARDTADPEMKWKLEELGGGVPVEPLRSFPAKPAAAERVRREEMVGCK